MSLRFFSFTTTQLSIFKSLFMFVVITFATQHLFIYYILKNQIRSSTKKSDVAISMVNLTYKDIYNSKWLFHFIILYCCHDKTITFLYPQHSFNLSLVKQAHAHYSSISHIIRSRFRLRQFFRCGCSSQRFWLFCGVAYR